MEQLFNTADDKLVEEFMSGNEAAFDVLLKRHQDKLYTYILFIVRNEDMADDLFQETFVKAIVNLRQGRYTSNGKFYAWLTRIAHNLLIDQFRNERNDIMVREADTEKSEDCASLLFDTYRENEIYNEQVLKDIRRLVDHLPDAQRQVIYMRFYQDMSFKEIAEATNVSINTALGRVRYGISNMKRMAEEYHMSLSLE